MSNGDAVCKRIPWEDLGAQRRVIAVSPAEMRICIRLGVVRALVPIFEGDPRMAVLEELAEDPPV